MNYHHNGLSFEVNPISSLFFQAHVIVPSHFVAKLYRQTSLTQQDYTFTQGFARGNTPISFIESAYRVPLLEHLKELMLNHLVLDFLYQELRTGKLAFTGEPRLTDVKLDADQEARFTFSLTTPDVLALKGWKFYTFKAPKRKNYRDLDRQVELFLKQELEANQTSPDTIGVGDWICFELCIVDHEQQPLLTSHSQVLWLKIGNEEVDQPFQELFCNKRIGDVLYTNQPCLQEYFSNRLDTKYLFSVIIKDILSDAVFSIEDFKTSFRLRTNKEMHKKLIEVFSYRNDLSQRREMVEGVFNLLLGHHEFQAPEHLVLRQHQALLLLIQENPDYPVYRAQRNFDEKVRLLAEKQIKEMIVIDQLSLKENIMINHHDVKQYLNLIKRPRTKEFIYFDSPLTKINGQEIPIPAEILKHHCLREKTINHLIYHLTRK
jgi:FKBP-type peptidyl-prolyl cis-trans isomerase (trigger factor)